MTPADVTYWPAGLVPDYPADDFSWLGSDLSGNEPAVPDPEDLTTSSWASQGLWAGPTFQPGFLFSPTNAFADTFCQDDQQDLVSELAPAGEQRQPASTDVLVPSAIGNEAEGTSGSAPLSEEDYFPLVKITEISKKSIPSKLKIDNICEGCPEIITSVDGGYRLDATGLSCWYEDCQQEDNFLIERVSRQLVHNVAVSCRTHVAKLRGRQESYREQWLRNCLDCSRLDPPRDSHAVVYMRSKDRLTITAARCREHDKQYGKTTDQIVSQRRKEQSVRNSSSGPKVLLPNPPSA